MKHVLLTGASVLALGIAPLVAQERTISPSGDPGSPFIGVQSEEGANREPGARQNRSSTERTEMNEERPAREGMAGPSSQRAGSDGASSDPWSGGVPFPPQDVSDQNLEPGGTPYPSGYPDRAAAGVGEPSDGSDSADQFVQEGEQVPEDIERYQGEDMWEGDDGRDVDADEGPSTLADKRNRNGDGQRLSSERSETGAVDRSERRAEREGRRGERRAMNREAREERRLRQARVALRTARNAVPDARFRTYEFETRGDRRVIEIAGADPESGERVEVDVFPNGRVHSISQTMDLDSVPDRIRDTVREEVGRFRVVHTFRSLRRDLDLYYEFAGFSASGRPAVVEIRADGRDMSVQYVDRG